ncbi:unannotated protein [freshwater metagenome]|uniref:Unannotated protein n=1 Tax=freshwater metagenome TaxID=449393 RepID=A0A6J7FN32_9ZZZZ|nr:hypothetical protein [Actinomycetota bacterium]
MIGPSSSAVVVLELGGLDIAEFAVQAPIVEPFDPAEGDALDVLAVTRRPVLASANHAGEGSTKSSKHPS